MKREFLPATEICEKMYICFFNPENHLFSSSFTFFNPFLTTRVIYFQPQPRYSVSICIASSMHWIIAVMIQYKIHRKTSIFIPGVSTRNEVHVPSFVIAAINKNNEQWTMNNNNSSPVHDYCGIFARFFIVSRGFRLIKMLVHATIQSKFPTFIWCGPHRWNREKSEHTTNEDVETNRRIYFSSTLQETVSVRWGVKHAKVTSCTETHWKITIISNVWGSAPHCTHAAWWISTMTSANLKITLAATKNSWTRQKLSTTFDWVRSLQLQ